MADVLLLLYVKASGQSDPCLCFTYTHFFSRVTVYHFEVLKSSWPRNHQPVTLIVVVATKYRSIGMEIALTREFQANVILVVRLAGKLGGLVWISRRV